MKKNIDKKTPRLKNTKIRTFILDLFSKSSKPLSVKDIISIPDFKKLNLVTIYRTLASFENEGILKKVDLRKGVVFYELSNHHHHHIVCNKCGDIEDFDLCLSNGLIKKIEKQSKKFVKLSDHALEFFGECKKCVKYA